MPDSRRSRVLLLASVLLAALPVTFGLIRAISTGDDLRYLWVAGAAFLGSMMVAPRRRLASGPVHVPLSRALGAVAAGSACAAAIALLLGTRAGPGLAIVAAAFGLCTGMSAVFADLARQQRMAASVR